MMLEGFTTRPRHGVVFEVTEFITANGGTISDHQQFSNHLLRLSIEIRGNGLPDVLAGLEAARVRLSPPSMDQAIALFEENPGKRIAGTLVIRCVSDEPDLRIPIPVVPG